MSASQHLKPLNFWLEVFLAIFSIAGTLVISFAHFEAFYLYLIANFLGIALFYRLRMYWTMSTQIAFLACSINGIWQNLL